MNMETNLQAYERIKHIDNDHVATPRWVVENIYNLINIRSFHQIWFPFNHYDSQFKLKADELNLKYWATHIFDDLGHDFFTTLPPKGTDLMISNPPFSQQNKIIERSFYLIEAGCIKSFALLLPLSTLEAEKRANMFEAYQDKLSIIIFKKRIKFLGHTTSFNKGCCWICYNIEALKDITRANPTTVRIDKNISVKVYFNVGSMYTQMFLDDIYVNSYVFHQKQNNMGWTLYCKNINYMLQNKVIDYLNYWSYRHSYNTRMIREQRAVEREQKEAVEREARRLEKLEQEKKEKEIINRLRKIEKDYYR